MHRTTLTRRGAETLRRELHRLRETDLPAAVAAFETTVDDAEQVRARASVEALERRLDELDKRLASAQVIDIDPDGDGGRVRFGARVRLRPEPDGDPVCYRIVDAEEGDIPSGRLSVSAPLARALLGHREDEEIAVETPRGTVTYRILEVRQG